MAIRDFTQEIRKSLDRLIKSQKGGFLPDGGVTSVEIDAATMPSKLVAATRSIIKGIAEKQNQGTARKNLTSAPVMRYRRYNKQEVWKRMIADLASDITKIQPTKGGYTLGEFGRLKPKSARKFKKDPSSVIGGVQLISGAYLNTARSNLIIIDLVLGKKGTKTATDMGISDSKLQKAVADLFNDLRDQIWDKWIDHVESKEGVTFKGQTTSGYNLGRSDDSGVRYSSSAKGILAKQDGATFGALLTAGGVRRAHKKAVMRTF